VYDELFGAIVGDNAEGTVLASRDLDEPTVTELITGQPAQSAPGGSKGGEAPGDNEGPWPCPGRGERSEQAPVGRGSRGGSRGTSDPPGESGRGPSGEPCQVPAVSRDPAGEPDQAPHGNRSQVSGGSKGGEAPLGGTATQPAGAALLALALAHRDVLLK
jgi:hypothetical protein